MADTRSIARQLAHPLRSVPDAEKITRDALAGRLDAASWAAAIKGNLPAALAAMDNHDLQFPLYQRFIQPAMFARSDVLPWQTWTAVLQRFNAALMEDALPVYVAAVSAAVDDVASRLDVIRARDEAALAEAIARLDAAPFRHGEIVAAMSATPRFDAVLADIDANPPPVPQEQPPPPRADPIDGLKSALGRVGSVFGALFAGKSGPAADRAADVTEAVDDVLKEPRVDPSRAQKLFSVLGKLSEVIQSSGPAPAEPILVARHTGPVVALRVAGGDVLSCDTSGKVLTTPVAGGPSAPSELEVPVAAKVDLDAWPPTPGPVVATLSLGSETMVMVGVTRDGGGYVCLGRRGQPDWEAMEDDDPAWLCVAPHPEGFVVGGSDGSIRVFTPECEPVAGAELAEAPVVGQLQADEIRIPLMACAVRSVRVVGEDAVAGLQDGRVIRIAL